MKIAALALALLCLSACSKSTTSTGTTVKFSNKSSSPYQCYVDGVPKIIVAGSASQSVDVSVGIHQLEAVQTSGYTGTPNDKTITAQVAENTQYEFIFP